ncbi:MAG: ATP-binding protein [Lentimicrobiaceae bacterium]|nr:ATP-binding protein [Lentimicrobiaceae bacterium]
MKTRSKIMLVLLSTTVLFICILLVAQNFNKRQYRYLIDGYRYQQEISSNAILNLQSQKIQQTAYDYTYWDDMVNFVKKPVKIWGDDNVKTILSSFKVNVALVYNLDLKPVYEAYDDSNSDENSFEIKKAIFDSLYKKHFINYFISSPSGLIEISGATVHATNDVDRKTPPQGYFFLAKFWDKEKINELETVTGCKVSYHEASNNFKINIPPNVIQTEIVLKNWQGVPTYHVQFSKKYSLLKVVNNLNYFQIIFIAVMAVIILSIFYLTSIRWISYPLQLVSESLTSNNKISLFRLQRLKSEFRQIGYLIENVNNQKKLLEEEINERKLAVEKLGSRELQLSASLEAADQGIWDWNLETGSIFFDDTWKNLHSFNDNFLKTSFETWEQYINPDDIVIFKQKLNDHLTDTKHLLDVEYRTHSGEKQQKWINCKGRVITFSENGKPVRMIGTVQDVSKRKAFENELEEAKKKAEESDILKSAFLANMSHEIRTPMNGILGFTQILKEPDITKKEQMEYLAIIENSGNLLLNLINDIVDISKIEAGLINVIPSQQSLDDLLDHIYNFFKENTRIKERQIQFTLEKPENNPMQFIRTDKTRFTQIFTNLIGNAIKFTNAGSITFGYTYNNGTLIFFVKDTGEGIATDKQQIIFERFMQAESKGSRLHEGTGLGLAISKAFVELLGGKIWVESQEGKGSTFYFSHPYTERIEENEPVPINIRPAFQFDWSMKTILVVEDVESNYMLIKIILRNTHATLLWAKNGKEAVDAVKLNPAIDIVIMDLRMPVMNGYEATRIIKQMRKDLPVIAQTAYSLDTDKNKSKEAGCDDYITKPINSNEMLMKIQNFFTK